jgi:DNA-directed RNA polymerase alpha subunit
MSEKRNRDDTVQVRVNPNEKRTIEKLAHGEGISVAEAMRRLILKSTRGDVRGAGGTKRGA